MELQFQPRISTIVAVLRKPVVLCCFLRRSGAPDLDFSRQVCDTLRRSAAPWLASCRHHTAVAGMKRNLMRPINPHLTALSVANVWSFKRPGMFATIEGSVPQTRRGPRLIQTT